MTRAGGFLYAIKIEGTSLVKIGCTAHVEKRVKALQAGQPFPVHLVTAVPVDEDMHRIEKQIHAFLAEEHRRGEWFDVAMDAEQFSALVIKAIAYLAKEETVPLPRRNDLHPLSIFQERLCLARRRAGMNQDDLAKAIHAYSTDVSKMERGKMLPTAPRLRRLAIALGVSSDYLLGLEATAVRKNIHQEEKQELMY